MNRAARPGAFVLGAALALGVGACRENERAPVVVKDPSYLVVRSISREADAEHTERLELPYAGAGYGFASATPLLDLSAFDLRAAGFAGGRTSLVGEATLWLPLEPEAAGHLAAWVAAHPDGTVGIFLKGRLVSAPAARSLAGGGVPLRVSGKSEGDRVLKELRAGGSPGDVP
ncbi:MAG TPA: hypothetical protein VMN82_15405 [Thermoanaerobaculia bacterium]|nr:hypothetical protein [Thermoanaerobaculia bacterium]